MRNRMQNQTLSIKCEERAGRKGDSGSKERGFLQRQDLRGQLTQMAQEKWSGELRERVGVSVDGSI